jgi:hypothetical protein
VLCTVLYSCGGGSSEGLPVVAQDTGKGYEIALSFERIEAPGLDPFTVTARITQNGKGATGLSPSVLVEQGVLGTVAELGNGIYRFTVTPLQTGEHRVTVSVGDASVTRTALVLHYVQPDWGQPLAVPGDYVNTEGLEDGITISPDGEWLFVQYGPFYPTGLFIYMAEAAAHPDIWDHPWIRNCIGPYAAPQRPGFFDARISDGTITHRYGIPLLETAPLYSLPTMFYGFRRQNDGTFAQPFFIAVDDNRLANLNPYGLTMRMNGGASVTLAFAFNDPYGIYTDGADIVTTDIVLGKDVLLGNYREYPPTFAPLVRLAIPEGNDNGDFGSTENDNDGTQGNPHLFCDANGVIRSVWFDSEMQKDRLFVYVLETGTFPGGTWALAELPAKINSGAPATQPFFTGSELYFRRDEQVKMSRFSGEHTAAGYSDGANWSEPETILQADALFDVGRISVVGEPTIARRAGQTLLYFAYGKIRKRTDPVFNAYPDIDLNAGFVAMN